MNILTSITAATLLAGSSTNAPTANPGAGPLSAIAFGKELAVLKEATFDLEQARDNAMKMALEKKVKLVPVIAVDVDKLSTDEKQALDFMAKRSRIPLLETPKNSEAQIVTTAEGSFVVLPVARLGINDPGPVINFSLQVPGKKGIGFQIRTDLSQSQEDYLLKLYSITDYINRLIEDPSELADKVTPDAKPDNSSKSGKE